MKNLKVSLRQIWTIASKEYRAYFSTPIAYLLLAGFLFILSWLFFFNLDHVGQLTLQYRAMGARVASITDGIVRPLFGSMNVIFLFITPFITMRLFAEERKMQTFQLLQASPLSVGEMLFGKFFGALFLTSTLLALTAIYPILLFQYSNADLGPILTNYLGVFLMECCYLAMGVFFSAISENQIAAGAMSFAAGFFFWLISLAGQASGPILQVILEYLSLTQHFDKMSQGILNSADGIFYLSFVGLGLFFTYRVLNYRKRDLGSRSVLVPAVTFALIALLNFAVGHNPVEIDFTKNEVHALSDQTTKALQALDTDLKADFFGEYAKRSNFRPLFESYQKRSSHFKLEYIDIFKEPTRVKSEGIKKTDTLVFRYHNQVIKVEDPTETKMTSAILKLERSLKSEVCVVVGHGEASINDVTQNGFQSLKNALEDQSYEVKEISLHQKKIPQDCKAIAMLGPHGAMYADELKVLSEYLEQGGRAVFGFDAVIKNGDEIPVGLKSLLNTWGIFVQEGLVIDPEAQKLGVDASLILVSLFNPHHPITHDTQPLYSPFTRPIEFKSPAPPGLILESLARTNDQAWTELDLNSFIKGNATFDEKSERKGNLSVAVSATGKDARVVVFGSSQFVNNQYSRLGGNLDFLLNAVHWVLNEENLISIRTREDEAGHVELSEREGGLIFWFTVIVLPVALLLLGYLIWRRNKRL